MLKITSLPVSAMGLSFALFTCSCGDHSGNGNAVDNGTTVAKTKLADTLPATEIYLLDIQKKENKFSLAENVKPINISNNKGYDNQPVFIEEINSIAYVSSRNYKPTDIYLYDIKTANSKQFTSSEGIAEYSPKITPDGKYISVVKDTEQNLTRISLDGLVTEKLYKSNDSIGYYCWLDSDEIAAYVLTKPVTLKLINIKNKTEQPLTDSMGRSLFKFDSGVVVSRKLHNGNQVTFVDRKGICKPLILFPLGDSTEDFYVTEDGWLFSSDSSSIIYCNIKELSKGWQELGNLKKYGISKIYRISVNRALNKIAFVTDEKK